MSTQTLYEIALQLSEPDKYDNMPPEKRAVAIEEALKQQNDEQDSSSFTSSATSKKVALRAVCDPWSSTRKKMSKIICEQIKSSQKKIEGIHNTNNNNNNQNNDLQEIESWILESAKSVLGTHSQQQQQQPWYVLDGFLLFVKMLLDHEEAEIQREQTSFEEDYHFSVGREHSSQNENNNHHNHQQTHNGEKKFSFLFLHQDKTKNCQTLLRLVLPQCVHPQECVRDCAADIVVCFLAKISSLTTTSPSLQSSSPSKGDHNDDDDEYENHPISLDSLVESVVSSKSNLKSQWWTTITSIGITEPHWIDLGKLALANRGIGISSLFSKTEENHQKNEGTLLEHWASSKLASVRFSCSSLFAKTDFKMKNINNNNNNNSFGVSSLLIEDDAEVHFRLSTLALNKWLLNPQSEWTTKETAAIACGDLLKSYLPARFERRRSSALLDKSNSNSSSSSDSDSSSSTQELSNLLKQVERMGNDKYEAVFDVRRACAELLPLLCQYVVVTSESISFIIDVLLACFTSNSETSCCQGHLQLGSGSSSSSCCAAQNLLWFLTLKISFVYETKDRQESYIEELNAATEKLKATILQVLKSSSSSSSSTALICPRVKLLLIVYGRGLFGENIFDQITDHNNNDQYTSILACDVRWIADMIRMNPFDVFNNNKTKNGILELVEYCILNHLDSYVQEMIFTALHDVAHIYSALLIHSKEEQENKSNIIPFSISSTTTTINNKNVFSISPKKRMESALSSSSSSLLLFNNNNNTILSNANVSPFLFAMDTSRFAPPALQQDGSDALSDGTLWIQTLHDPTNHSSVNFVPSGSHASSSIVNGNHSNNVTPPTSLRRARLGSFVTTHSAGKQLFEGYANFQTQQQQKNRNNNNSSCSISIHQNFNLAPTWCQTVTILDQDKIYSCIENLSLLAARLLNILLLTGKSSSSIEFSSLSRAADATRSLTRAISGLTCRSEDDNDADTNNADSITETNKLVTERAEKLLIDILLPWMFRFDLILKKSKSTKPTNSSNPPKKASDSNWDDDDDDESDKEGCGNDFDDDTDDESSVEDDVGCCGEGVPGNVGSSVTKDQERECLVAALRHLTHVSSSMVSVVSTTKNEEGDAELDPEETITFQTQDDGQDDDGLQPFGGNINLRYETSGVIAVSHRKQNGAYEAERVEFVRGFIESNLRPIKNQFADACEKLKEQGCGTLF